MANWETPKSTGELVSDINLLHPGDGLCIGDQGCYVNAIRDGKIIPNKPIHQLTDSPIHQLTTPVYRNYDSVFQRSLHAERRVVVDICFEETPDGFRLTYTPVSGGHGFTQCFVCHKEAANNPERALRTIREQISKLGDTIYTAREIIIKTQPYFIPISQLNQWRRTVLANR